MHLLIGQILFELLTCTGYNAWASGHGNDGTRPLRSWNFLSGGLTGGGGGWGGHREMEENQINQEL